MDSYSDDVRPMTFGAVLDYGTSIIRRSPVQVLIAVAVIELPLRLLFGVLLFDGSQDGIFTSDILGLAGNGDGFADSLPAFGATITNSLQLAVLGVALGLVVEAGVRGHNLGARAMLAGTARRLPAIGAAWFLVRVAGAVGFFAAGIGTLLVVVIFSIVGPILGMETRSPIKAMSRSWTLVFRSFFLVLGRVAGVILVSTLVSLALTGVLGFGGGTGILINVARAVTVIVSGCIIDVFVAGAAIGSYLDLRARSEGVDLTIAAGRALPL